MITLIKLETVSLYLDLEKKIIFLDILSSTYSKDDFILLIEYFKNFWILAKEQNKKYYLIIKINEIGIYPLNFYTNLVKILTNLNEYFEHHLNSCCFICKNNNPLKILKPLFSVYKFIRPYTICSNYEEALQFFSKNYLIHK